MGELDTDGADEGDDVGSSETVGKVLGCELGRIEGDAFGSLVSVGTVNGSPVGDVDKDGG